MKPGIKIMKALFVLTISLFSLNELCAQSAPAKNDSYFITGNITQAEKGTMMLSYWTGKKAILDSAVIESGNFYFKGSLKFPTPARIYLKGTKHQYAEQNLNFYLENSAIQIFVNTDSMFASVVKGSRSNDDKEAISALLAPYYESMGSLRKVRDFASSQHLASVLSNVDKIYDELPDAQRKLIVDYALAHPNSYAISEMLFINFTNNQTDLPLLQKVYGNFSDSVKASVGGQQIAALLERMERVAIGNTAPGFSLPNEQGNMVKLSSFKGKYVLLDFWASWCVPCRQETPFLVEAFHKYKNRNFTIVSVSLDVEKDKQKWLDAIQKDGMAWTNLSSLKGYVEEGARQLYSVQGIPDNFLISPDGKIIARGLRGMDLEKKLSEVIK